jgi:hypothetical protein
MRQRIALSLLLVHDESSSAIAAQLWATDRSAEEQPLRRTLELYAGGDHKAALRVWRPYVQARREPQLFAGSWVARVMAYGVLARLTGSANIRDVLRHCRKHV